MTQLNQENLNKKSTYQLFIEIVLYLLLAFAFFSNYFVQEKGILGTTGPKVFLVGIISIILLIFFGIKYKWNDNNLNSNKKIFWAIFSITPFILMTSFILVHAYFVSFSSLGDLIKANLCAESNWIIFSTMIIMLVVFSKEKIINFIKRHLKKICLVLLIIILILLNRLFYFIFCK